MKPARRRRLRNSIAVSCASTAPLALIVPFPCFAKTEGRCVLFLVRMLEPRKQAACVPALAPDLLDPGIELVDPCGDGQARAVAAGLGDCDREVLAHPFHRESEIVF